MPPITCPAAQIRLGGRWRPLVPVAGDWNGRVFVVPVGVPVGHDNPRINGLSDFDLVLIDGPEAGPAASALATGVDAVVLAGPDGRIMTFPANATDRQPVTPAAAAELFRAA
jgi:hypothetical protein